MQSRIVEWFQEDHFAAASLNKVEVFEIKGKDTLSQKYSFDLPSPLSCISCSSSRGLVAVGQQSGNVSFIDVDKASEVVIYDSSSARRPCTAVSWNKLNSSQLAAGFEKSRSQGEFCAVVWDVESGSGTGGKVLFRPTSEEPTASICWLDAHVLAVGTSISWVRLYDVRMNSSQQGQGGEIMSIMAHTATRPRKVKGIRCDQLQQHTIASFSDSPGEPIKIWDLRKAGITAKPKLMIVQSQVAAVVDVAWSAARAGVLAVATNQSRNVNFYSTIRPVTELVTRIPFHTITAADPVKSLSWKTGATAFDADSSNTSSRSNRLLVATTSGFADVDVIESVGLGQGAGGRVAVAAGRSVDIVRASDNNIGCWGEGPFRDIEALMGARCTGGYSIDAGKNLQVLSDQMDALLAAKERKKEKQSYESYSAASPSTATSSQEKSQSPREPIEISVNEIPEDNDMTLSSYLSIPSMVAQVQALSRLWAWVDRVESLSNEDVTLSCCGVISLLVTSIQLTSRTVHAQLGVPVYSCGNRDFAREICGWAREQLYSNENIEQPQQLVSSGANPISSKVNSLEKNKSSLNQSVDFEPLSELEAMVAECEESDSFERAAAIALFHGDLTLAVKVLQRHIPKTDGESQDMPFGSTHNGPGDNSFLNQPLNEGEGIKHPVLKNGDSQNDGRYAQLISLTAMCIAGFNNSYTSSSSSSSSSSGSHFFPPQQEMWASMCKHVVSQLDLQTNISSGQGHSSSSSSCYLAAALRFLLDTLHRTGSNDENMKYGCIVNDDRLSWEDRIAFACTYLDDERALKWLRDVRDDCTLRGELGGLLTTGLTEEGLDLLQQYLDKHDDLQTVALLAGRNVIDNAATSSSIVGGSSSLIAKSREWQWLWEYRNLLNKMQLFIGRASLDVELGGRNRLIAKSGPAILAGPAGGTSGQSGGSYGQNKLKQSQPLNAGGAGRGSGSVVDRKSGSARVLYQVPPHSDLTHVFLRCNYCSSSLPVDPLLQQQAAFFRKQRPLINCCANCKKPLPRCYVCLLHMGLVNPTHEFNRALVQMRKAASDVAPKIKNNGDSGAFGYSDEVPHNVLSFGQWFFFCQHCKHGGHAACIDDWFEGEDHNRERGREVCGVNGCSCHCRALK